jgi:hypothetical protein
MRSLAKLLLVGGAIAGLVAALSIWQLNNDVADLPSRTMSLSELATVLKSETPTRRIVRSSDVYYEVLLTDFSTGAMRSGPTAYVYRADGRFEDWALDRGEASQFVKRWGEFGDGKPITLKQAVEETQSMRQ